MRRIVTLLTLLLCVAACAAEPVQMNVFDRGIETWQPDPSSLSFDWARACPPPRRVSATCRARSRAAPSHGMTMILLPWPLLPGCCSLGSTSWANYDNRVFGSGFQAGVASAAALTGVIAICSQSHPAAAIMLRCLLFMQDSLTNVKFVP